MWRVWWRILFRINFIWNFYIQFTFFWFIFVWFVILILIQLVIVITSAYVSRGRIREWTDGFRAGVAEQWWRRSIHNR